MTGKGLQVEHVTTKHRHRFWFENPVIGRPLKDLVTAGVDERLFPTECREAVRCSESICMHACMRESASQHGQLVIAWHANIEVTAVDVLRCATGN